MSRTGFNLAKWLYSDKSGCIRAKVVVFGQKLLYSGRGGAISSNLSYTGKVVVFGQNWLYSGKVAVFGKSACILPKWL